MDNSITKHLDAHDAVSGKTVNSTGYLNAFRGFAAFWVVLAHCLIWGGWVYTIPDPKIAVDIFMMLSGFLMAFTLSARERTEPITSAHSWLQFYVRRFFRIAPAYYVVLALVAILSTSYLAGMVELRHLNPARWVGDTDYDPSLISYDLKNLLMHFSFLFGFSPFYSNSTQLPDWSLGLEMQFYIVFPALFLVIRRHTNAVICLALALYVLMRALGHWHIVAFREPSLLFYKLPMFLIGVLIFEAAEHGVRRQSMRVLIGLICVAQFWQYGPWSMVPVAIAYALFELWTDTSLTVARRVLDNRITNFMSDVSYSVYLLHGLFLSYLGSRVDGWMLAHGAKPSVAALAVCAAVIPATYAVSYVCFNLVEKPGIVLGHIVARRMSNKRHRVAH